MDELLSEKEQIEAIRSWWSENGRFVIAGLVCGIGTLAGWRYWQEYKETRAESASAVFEQLSDAIQSGDEGRATALTATLSDEFSATPYLDQAQLLLARLYMDQDQPDQAVAWLEKVASGARDEGLSHLARLRLARVLLDQDRADEALARIPGNPPTGFAARYHEVRGDALVAKGSLDQARAAYSEALLAFAPDATAERRYVEMKLSGLGTAGVEQAAALDSIE